MSLSMKLEPLQLNDSVSFEAWEERIKDFLYAKSGEAMFEASHDPDPDARAANSRTFTDAVRRECWFAVKASLSETITKKVKHIPAGEVEQLLRAIRAGYYRNSVHTKYSLMANLQKIKLDQFQDLPSYIAELKHIQRRFLACDYKLQEDDLIFNMFRGLPVEYKPVIQALKLPRVTPLTLEQIVEQLEEFAQDPDVPGTTAKKPKDVALTSSELCRSFAKSGRCRFNDRCRFRHERRPSTQESKQQSKQRSKCTYCKRKGHISDNCFKRIRTEKEKKDKDNGKVKENNGNDEIQSAHDPQENVFLASEQHYPDDHIFSLVEQPRPDSVNLNNNKVEALLLDGGASCHVTFERKWCVNIRQCNITILTGTSRVKCYKIGDMYLKTTAGATIILQDVRIVPTFRNNIVAERRFLSKGCKITKSDAKAVISRNGEVVLEACRAEDGMQYLDARVDSALDSAAVDNSSAFVTRSHSTLHVAQLWHNRLGHRHMRDVHRITGVPEPRNMFCAACVESKSTRFPMPKKLDTPRDSPRAAYLLHADAAGPFRVATLGGARYLVVLVDDYSNHLTLFLLNSLSEFYPRFKELLSQLEAQFGREKVVAQLLTDNATYFEKSNPLAELCKQKGIYQLRSPPYTQERNGKAERTIGTVMAMTRALLIHAGAPLHLWGEAAAYSVFILNQLPYKAGTNQTRLERWSGRKKSKPLQWIKTWGCSAYALLVHPTAAKIDKLASKTITRIFVGVDPRRQSYRLYERTTRKITYSAHVTFNEDSLPFKDAKTQPAPTRSTQPAPTQIHPTTNQSVEADLFIRKVS